MGEQRRNRERFQKRKISHRGKKVNAIVNSPKLTTARSRRQQCQDILDDLDGIDFS